MPQRNFHITFLLFVATLLTTAAHADVLPENVEVDYSVRATFNASSAELAPYYIASNRDGTLTQGHSALLDVNLSHQIDSTERFSWGAGLNLWTGASSSVEYLRYNTSTNSFDQNPQHPARFWINQAFLDLKYRALKASIGMKHHCSTIVNEHVASGDLVLSDNARPPIGINVGFCGFHKVPLTKGELQVNAEIGFYKLANGRWLEHHYNFYNHYLTTSYWFNYKNLYLRTNPERPVVLTIGAQAACQFAGNNVFFNNGVKTSEVHMAADIKAFFRTIIPGSGGNNVGDRYVEGNHVGSWDVALQWRNDAFGTIKLYHQNLWEDGSGIGKLNGFDGLWGIEYRPRSCRFLQTIVAEFLDLTNQSGPIHWAPDDHHETPLTNEATGADDYYNNYAYNGYQAFGMSIGSPFVKSPIYNTDGYMRYTDNLMRGFHLAAEGSIIPQLDYRAKLSFRKSWGTPLIPRITPVTDTSWSLELTYTLPKIPLHVTAQLAQDIGNLYGDNFGALLSLKYCGKLLF